MTIQQPVGTDKLSTPDHSLSHRVFANDDASPVQSVVVDSSGNVTISKITTTGGRKIDVLTKTDSYTAETGDDVIVCNKTTVVTITLPAASGGGQRFYIKNIGAGTVTIDGNSNDTIDNVATAMIGQWECLTIVDYAANKWVII